MLQAQQLFNKKIEYYHSQTLIKQGWIQSMTGVLKKIQAAPNKLTTLSSLQWFLFKVLLSMQLHFTNSLFNLKTHSQAIQKSQFKFLHQSL